MQEQISVTILMATYNGELYLAEQLDSILKQTYQNWKLVIRDDYSTDNTLKIIENYSKRYPSITRIDYGTAHGSACKNFSELALWAAENSADYVMFADQDDIWKADKLAESLAAILQLEMEFDKEIPLLCYSDFQFIDADGNLLPQKLALPEKLELRVLLNENHAWGCTMILNQKALNAIIPIPFFAVNHDYWIAMVIAALGQTKLISQDLIFYRQHSHNVSGNVDNMSFAKRFNRYIANQDYMIGPLSDNLITIRLFYTRYKDQLNNKELAMVNSFLTAYENSFLNLLLIMLKYKIFKIGIAKNAAYFYTLLLLREKVLNKSNTSPANESALR